MPPKKKPPAAAGHSLADHLYGEGLLGSHEHGPDADHDHDDFAPGRPEDDAIFLADNVHLLSVGMDIGSAGTQVIFARLHLRRLGADLSSRYQVVSREAVYQSPVALTPYRSEELIDEVKLGEIIDEAYRDARLGAEDIDAGVVILTGEALRRENAEAIAGILAEHGGEFVCATAGHHMEAMLAAYGSGAAKASIEHGKCVLNVDIGGGTTKLSVVERGRVVATAAIHIGGRLLVVDAGNRIVRLDPAARQIAAHAGFQWRLGDVAAPEQLDRVTGWMADALIAALRGEAPLAVQELWLTEPLGDLAQVEAIMFSGGVGEFVYGRESRDFGDLGRRLGEAVRERLGRLPWPLLPAGECIRATALGASEYSVQLSGNTIYISDLRALLPRRNLQVLQPAFDCPEEIDPETLAAAIRAHFSAFDLAEGEKEVALALRWRGAPSYARLKKFAAGIAAGLENTIAAGKPLYLVLDGDVAQMLGNLLREEFVDRSELLVIDGIVLWDFDYIDIGRLRLPSNTVPVTVKSLVFNEDPRAQRTAAHVPPPLEADTRKRAGEGHRRLRKAPP